MVLSLAPVVATLPDNRLLLFAGLGALGLVAVVIGDLRQPAPATAPRVLRGSWIAIHLLLSALLLPIVSLAMPLLAHRFEPPPAGPGLAGQTVVLVNAPVVAYGVLASMYPIDPDRTTPRRVLALTETLGRVEVTREDAKTLLVEQAPDAMGDPMGVLLSDEAHPKHEGDVFAVPGMRAEVVRLGANQAPVSVRYRFERDLDDASFRWVGWNTGFVKITPPRMGARLALGGE